MRPMKALLVILLVQHAVISARAGLITYVRNLTVAVDEHIGEGNEVHGGPGSRFEAMLTPDSYVRMRGASAIALESETLDRTVIRVLSGTAIIDAGRVDRDIPIRVRLGELEFSIAKDGLYLFEEDRVVVLDGEMNVTPQHETMADGRLRKGWAVARSEADRSYVRIQLDTDEFDALPLVRWSRQRSAQLAPERTLRRDRPGRRWRF